MRYSEAKIGRTFVIRLHDGERLPDVIEEFAAQKNVLRGVCILIGGINHGGTIVVGPEDGDTMPPTPMLLALKGVHEVAGVGTLFPDAQGKPVLHMHATLGREDQPLTGCIRPGVEVWQVGEIVLTELVDNTAERLRDAATGFDLLEP